MWKGGVDVVDVVERHPVTKKSGDIHTCNGYLARRVLQEKWELWTSEEKRMRGGETDRRHL